MGVRLETWKAVTGKEIKFERLDVALEYERLVDLLIREKPDAMVHFAEQRAAPYSMKTSKVQKHTNKQTHKTI